MFWGLRPWNKPVSKWMTLRLGIRSRFFDVFTSLSCEKAAFSFLEPSNERVIHGPLKRVEAWDPDEIQPWWALVFMSSKGIAKPIWHSRGFNRAECLHTKMAPSICYAKTMVQNLELHVRQSHTCVYESIHELNWDDLDSFWYWQCMICRLWDLTGRP